MEGRTRAAVIKAATGDAVIVGEAELRHAMYHFTLPRDLVLSLIARVLENASALQEGTSMKKPRISFRHFSGSGPLSIYWHDGPFGDAVEARKGRGVAWLAPNGDLLGVEFDDVSHAADDQTLELPNGDTVTARVTRGKVTVRLRHSGRKTRAA